MRNGLYAQLVRLSFGFYDRHQTGQLMSRATVDLQGVRFFLGYGLIFFFQNVLTVVSVAVVLFFCRVAAGADRARLLAAPRRARLPLQPRLPPDAARRAAEARRRRDGGRGEHRRRPRRQGVRAGAGRADKFERRSRAVFRQSVRANRQRAFYVPLISFLPLLAQAAVLLVGARMVATARSRPAGSSRSTSTWRCSCCRCGSLGMWIGQAQRATASGERIFQVIDEPTEIADEPGARELPPGRGASASRASRSATTRRGPCSRARPGARAGNDGRADRAHGLRQDDARLADPALLRRQAGRVTVDGADVRELTLNSLRREIGAIAQDPFLFSATVRENIAFGRRRRHRRGGRAGRARSRRRTSSSSGCRRATTR